LICLRPELAERLPAHADGTATSRQQQRQCLSPFARPRQRERLAGQLGPCPPDRVEGVVFAGQPPFGSGCAAELEHDLAPIGKKRASPAP
jgi:hypothetical protein